MRGLPIHLQSLLAYLKVQESAGLLERSATPIFSSSFPVPPLLHARGMLVADPLQHCHLSTSS